jgi:hypothetical protein
MSTTGGEGQLQKTVAEEKVERTLSGSRPGAVDVVARKHPDWRKEKNYQSSARKGS